MRRNPFVRTALLLILSAAPFFSETFPHGTYGEYTLENGTDVFVLEDFSSASVRIEYAVKAGISSQSKENAGFFTLYSRLFPYAAPLPNDSALPPVSCECNADSSRYILTVAPAQFSGALEYLSKAAFNPVFTDGQLSRELDAMKNEVMQLAASPAAFINSSIDAKVFSAAPWKHDSGLYPALFAQTKPDEARTILSSIAKNWYVPQNSAVFITGCISAEDALSAVKKTFGAYKASPFAEKRSPVQAGGNGRKFVLVSNDFSTEITQIVVQFTALTMMQCDLAAAVCNADNSAVKKLLLRQKNLAIRDGDYIHAAAAHKSGSSRLIFQSLLEKPVNKKVSLADQAELFVSKVKEGAEITKQEEYSAAKRMLSESFFEITAQPRSYMDYLSQFWAVEQLDGNSIQDSPKLCERMERQSVRIADERTEDIQNALKAEKPFVFVLVSAENYQKNRQSFSKLGYEEITEKNGAWYTLSPSAFQKEKSSGTEGSDNPAEKTVSDENDFIARNRAQIETFTLANGIPVTIKKAPSTSTVLILAAVKGGAFSATNESGFDKVMTNAFASNIQKEINTYRIHHALESEPEILCEEFGSYSAITVECTKDDAAICLKCFSDALIFGEITPIESDSYLHSVQTQKRLYNASAQNQLYSAAVDLLYGEGIYKTVFDSESDILQNTQFTDILAAYPLFLDASLYSLVIVGNIDSDYLKEPLTHTFGQLARKKEETPFTVQTPDFPDGKRLSVKLRHLFFTDIKAEDAGPMPRILVPTTNFSDPVQYWLKAPCTENEALLFDALVFRLKELLDEKIGSAYSAVTLSPRTREVQGAAFTLHTVSRTDEADNAFAQTVKDFKERLSGEHADEEAQAVKNSWILNALDKTSENRGTAILIQNGGENPARYLYDYETVIDATAELFASCAETFIPNEPLLRLYSADAKK